TPTATTSWRNATALRQLARRSIVADPFVMATPGEVRRRREHRVDSRHHADGEPLVHGRSAQSPERDGSGGRHQAVLGERGVAVTPAELDQTLVVMGLV